MEAERDNLMAVLNSLLAEAGGSENGLYPCDRAARKAQHPKDVRRDEIRGSFFVFDKEKQKV